MSFDVRLASLEAAAQGTVDMYLWQKPDGEIVDSWITWPGQPAQDSEVSARHSETHGVTVSFVGPIAAETAAELVTVIKAGA